MPASNWTEGKSQFLMHTTGLWETRYILLFCLVKTLVSLYTVNLVCSLTSGNGKTYYIRQQLQYIPEDHQVTIAINESFTTASAIKKLCSLPRNEGCAVFFNFTILPPVVSACHRSLNCIFICEYILCS